MFLGGLFFLCGFLGFVICVFKYFPLLTHSETPGHGSGWAETPKTDRGGDLIESTPTPGASKRRSRWDETPGAATPSAMTPSMTPGGGSMTPSMTPGGVTPQGMTPQGMTPGGMTPSMTPSGVTPTGSKAMAMATPTPGHLMSMTPEMLQAFSWQKEIDERNRPLTDDDLEAMFPPGYKVSILIFLSLVLIFCWMKYDVCNPLFRGGREGGEEGVFCN